MPFVSFVVQSFFSLIGNLPKLAYDLHNLKYGKLRETLSLARIVNEPVAASLTIRPSGFDYGLFRPQLRANLEQGAKHRVETCKKARSLSCKGLFTNQKDS